MDETVSVSVSSKQEESFNSLRFNIWEKNRIRNSFSYDSSSSRWYALKNEVITRNTKVESVKTHLQLYAFDEQKWDY